MDRQETAFRGLFESASDLIQSVSSDGEGFLYVNRAWLRTLGYTPEEVPGLRVFDIVHPDSREHCRAVLSQLVDGTPITDIRADFITKDGRRIPVEGSAACRFEDGRPVATIGIFRDVSSRRRAEEELDRLFNLSPDLLCIAGTDGYFKRVNPAFEKALGYSREELLSRQFVDFVHPDDREQTLTEVRNLAAGRSVVDFKNRYRAKDGGYRWLSWRSTPSASDGLIYAVGREITEQRKAEEALIRRTAELARSNADLEQFAYVASHDLRTPLRSIATLTEWIEEEIQGAHPGEARKHLRQLRDRVRRMERLTDDLLEYSRAGKVKEEVSRVDTAGLVRDVVAILAPPEAFSVVCEGPMPVIETERAPLEQVLRNLVGNAIKHHDRLDGKIVVSTTEREGVLEFCVEDDGPGIPAQFHHRVFLMFQRFGGPSSEEGSGIGLALVQRLVEGRGGVVRLESSGRGARFCFTWPLAAAPHGGVAGG